MSIRPSLDSSELPEDEREFERQLTGLIPSTPGFDAREIWAAAMALRDQKRIWFWRGVSGALAACLVVTMWMHMPASPQILPVQLSQQLNPSPVAASHAIDLPSNGISQLDMPLAKQDDGYLSVRQRILQMGVEVVRPMGAGSGSQISRYPIMPLESDPATEIPSSPIVHFFNQLGKGV